MSYVLNSYLLTCPTPSEINEFLLASWKSSSQIDQILQKSPRLQIRDCLMLKAILLWWLFMPCTLPAQNRVL